MGNQPSQPVEQCDPECQRQKRLAQLKDTYDDAVRDETRDSAEVRQARKQYYKYDLGDQGYYDMESKTLANIADKHNSKLANKHATLLKEIKEQKQIQKDNDIALKNMDELLRKFKVSNLKIEDGLGKQEDTLETARRMVWYTNQRMDKVDFYEHYISIVVKVLIFIAIIFFLYDKKYGSLTVVIVFYLLIMHFL